jgi:hypothetical protein
MAGASIDHMVSVIILIAALLIAMTSYNNLFANAIDYESNRQVATKAVDLINNICLSPGNPPEWGQTNDTLLGFGLQDPEVGGYALSSHAIMRLRTSNSSSGDQIVYYPKTGLYYNNLSGNYGHAVFTPLADCINSSDIAELLGINGTYGFGIDIAPIIDVSISHIPVSSPQDPLILKVDVKGSGLPLSGASLDYSLFHVKSGSQYPIIDIYSGVNQTDYSGSAIIEFEDVDDSQDAYTFIVYARLGGISGNGYYTHNTLDDDHQLVVPLIQDYDTGSVIIAHSWDVNGAGEPPVPEIKYNATFFALTSDFQLQQHEIENSTGHLVYGEGNPYFTTQLPTSEIGFMLVSYKRDANRLGSVLLPWGVGALGFSASFASDSDPSNYDFVATELRQVTINGISYQVKLSTWSLNG